MEAYLAEIHIALRGLDTDKITERRNNQEKVLRYLERGEMLGALDQSTLMAKEREHARSNRLTWTDVFIACRSCVWAEVDKAVESKGPVTDALKKKIRASTTLIKTVVKKANRGKEGRLESTRVVKHILNVMKNQDARLYTGGDHTLLLLQEILSIRKYVCDIELKYWQELLDTYVQLLKTRTQGLDRPLLANTISSIIAGASVQSDINGKKALEVMNDFFADISKEGSPLVISDLLRAATQLCTDIACDSRTQTCKFGEKILGSLLVIWKKNNLLKDEVIKFCQLQMTLHHPHGARTEEDGAFAADWYSWKSKRKQLYEVIHEELKLITSRNVYSARDKCQAELSPEFLSLAVDVSRQLFTNERSLLSVTQLDPEDGPPTKRARLDIEIGWAVILAEMKKAGASPALIPWIQLLAEAMRKYPDFVPEELHFELLTHLQRFQAESKRLDVSKWILKCMRQMALCQLDSHAAVLKEMCHPIWQKIWVQTLRNVSLKHAEQDGFLLLTSLVHCKLVEPSKDVWLLFIPRRSYPSDESLHLLSALIENYSLPEKHNPNALYLEDTFDFSGSSFPLRLQLINWLLAAKDIEELFPSRDAQVQQQDTPKIFNIRLKAQILISLTLRNSQKVKHSWYRDDSPTDAFQTIADCYMKTTFNSHLIPNTNPRTETWTINMDKVSCVPQIKSEVMKLLKNNCRQLLQTSDFTPRVFELAVDECVLSITFLQHAMQYWDEPARDLLKEDFGESCTMLMKRMGENLENMTQGDRVTELIEHIKQLLHIFDCPEVFDKKTQCSELFTRIAGVQFEANLVDQLLHIAADNSDVQNMTLNRTCSRLSTKASSTRLDFSDSDDDMGMSSSNFNADADDDFDIQAESAVDQKTGKRGNPAGVMNPLSGESLTEKQKLRLLVVDLLCCLCQHSVETSNKTLPEPTVPVVHIAERLMDLIVVDDKDKFLPSRTYDLNLANHIIEGIGHASSIIPVLHDAEEGWEQEEMLIALKEILKCYVMDQHVAVRVLKLISVVVHKLSNCKEINESGRVHAMKYFSLFWSQYQSKFIHSTRYVIAQCLEQFIMANPEGDWIQWKMKGSDKIVKGIEEYPTILQDSHQLIRLLGAEGIKLKFRKLVNDIPVEFSREVQNDCFDDIYNQLMDTIALEENLNPDQEKDEKVNRHSTLLHTLMSVAVASPVCEQKAIFAICYLTTKHKFNTNLVLKILKQLSSQLGFSGVKPYMLRHLPFLVRQWFGEKQTLKEFPHELCGYKDRKSFYCDQSDVFIPFIIMRKNLEDVQTIARETDKNWKELILACLPNILIQILPKFATKKSDDESRKQLAHANACYGILSKAVHTETIEQSIIQNLESLVVRLLLTLHETESTERGVSVLLRNSDPPPNPPYYSSTTIRCTFDYLVKGYNTDSPVPKSLVSVLANKSHDILQTILLSLHTELEKSSRIHEKFRVLLAYRLFVSLLLQNFQEDTGPSWAFVLRDTIYTLLHTIQKVAPHVRAGTRHESVAILSMDILANICHTTSELCGPELGRFLSVITDVLIPLASSQEEFGQKCLSLLNDLLVKDHINLQSSIRLIDPLPEQPIFQDASAKLDLYKYSAGYLDLEQEIKHFLKIREHCGFNTLPRVDGLRSLHQQLLSRKEELSLLISECTDPASSVIPKLVHVLITISEMGRGQLGEHRHGNTVADEAARCLGELGTVDLSVAALHGPTENLYLRAALEEYQEEPVKQNYCRIIHMLDQFLLDPDIDTVIAASQVLKSALSTKVGMSFSTDYKGKTRDHVFQYLHPFRLGKKKVRPQSGDVYPVEEFVRLFSDEGLWCPGHNDHNSWIQNLVTTLIYKGNITDEILRLLAPVCLVKVKFCELILPMLIHDILMHGDEQHRRVFSRQLSGFFQRHCGMRKSTGRPSTPLIRQVSDNQDTICTNKDSVKTMLSVVQFLRCQPRDTKDKRKTSWDNNFWADIDYLQVARAAQNCSASFTTLLYSEIWCDVQRNIGAVPLYMGDSQSEESQASLPGEIAQSQGSQLEVLSSVSNPSNINVQDLMLEAQRCIGDPDGVYGCGAGRLADTSARIHTYEHENAWEKALGSYDIQSCFNPSFTTEMGLLQSLQNFGASHVLDTYLQGVAKSDSPELREFQYQVAWKSATWNIDIPERQDDSCQFHHAIFNSLNLLRDKDQIAINANLQIARQRTIETMSLMSLESARSFYPILSQMACVSLVEQLSQQWLKMRDISVIKEQLKVDESLLRNDFDFIEPVLGLRCSLMRVILENLAGAAAEEVRGCLISQLELTCKLSREAGRYVMAERALAQLQELENKFSSATSRAQFLSWHVQEAETFWVRDECNTAKHIMKTLLRKLDAEDDLSVRHLLPECLGIYGTWLAETRSESPSVVMEQYLERAVKLTSQSGYDVNMDAYMSLARYADGQYQNIVNHMKSSTFESKSALIKDTKEELDLMHGIENDRYKRLLERQMQIDQSEIDSMMKERQNFLTTAFENYLICLQRGDKHDMRVFRLMSLWFDNNTEDEINQLLQRELSKVKSYKFLPLMYQLAARMSEKQDASEFQTTLDQLIERTVIDHPHHCLPKILALAHAKKDKELDGMKRKTGRSSIYAEEQLEEDRVSAAKNMVERLRRSRIQQILAEMERLSIAYIQLANFDVSKHKHETRALPLPSGLAISKLPPLENICIPTVEVTIDPTCEYKELTSLVGFEKMYSLAGGINLPKIIKCRGSDGISRKQLVKGRDDLRQDAVMQQVFEMVNSLLKREQQTRKRQLTIRTYKIVPLSQKSGLLEWCDGTMPIGDYLVKTGSGAHEKYRPKDLKARECRLQMQTAHGQPNIEKKKKAFIKVCQKFQPVFRYFFLERFLDPTTWYERRLAYTRSVATNSIVGYILGLGDRHVQNILIDCTSAELVHIDLGVAFEQGKILPTPETIPFRLTRDIVDGMGVAGVEGVFRRSCEKTMEVMRQSNEALITILQVLLYDPMTNWIISPAMALKLQNRRGDESADITTGDMLEDMAANKRPGQDVNKVAERILLRLQQKLQGVEEGIPLSVSGQINHLIQEARDVKNLSRLFPGWQPYI